jgi:hypothetical protein
MAPSGAARNLTGLVSTHQGQHVWLINTGSTFAINLRHDQASTAANRIYTPGAVDPYTIPQFAMTELVYDSVVSRWRVLGR